jgi:acyl-CoA dehydrogenase
VRTLCLIRETLARHDGLADFAFAMQGLGTGAITLFGTDAETAEWLPKTRAGKAISAFALTEPASGSDVANMAMTATRDGDDYVLERRKDLDFQRRHRRCLHVSPAPVRRRAQRACRPSSCPPIRPGLRGRRAAGRDRAASAGHGCASPMPRCPASAMLGEAGAGFKVAMSVLDVFRSTVAAAALGFARRALDEALARVTERELCRARRCSICRWCRAISPTWRLTWMPRRCWSTARPGPRIPGAPRVTREAAMAKLYATDHRAEQVIDKAVQLHGGDGVRSGHIGERLYREIRALRIYEGASDVQRS